jgi:dipeptidyl-peptidase-3
VERYGVQVDSNLHAEVLHRYQALNLSPYKGFINPEYELVYDENGNVCDVKIHYGEAYDHQMLRYGKI